MGLASMPTGAKIGAGVVGLAGVSMLMYRILPPQMLYYVTIGVLALGVVLGGLAWVAAQIKQRKAKPMEKSLRDNSAATPQGVADPGRRARMDDLRRTFDTGVEKFKAAGKNLYSLPWYVLVGEPGSGKTEAVRHCNVGFPPGLQDQLQGAGGTINMNWWFTNHAIILDTAGRLMFEEVEPGATSEWREFLKLLRANRPNCPINGMLLCIPADSLIKDTAESLERKGAKIAQQLDQIQRALGVRFPVFVMVTKCDLINGFREFFEGITDPQLTSQMIGWSNPAPLDQPFNPELVKDHLQSVSGRLVRRRMGLLLDPINTEEASARRTDQVDALYAFPQSMMALAPRLQKYLEMIFVAGEWSAKPLFLRGIYFTSSLRHGSALDAELAEVLGVPVESLPEGKVWERDRSYFLQNLFVYKIFKEKGLVTNASNAKKRQRSRKAVVLAAGFLGVMLLGFMTWWGLRSFRDSIGAEAEYWKLAAQDKYWADTPYWAPIVSPKFKGSTDFNYDQATDIKDEKTGVNLGKIGKFHAETMDKVKSDIEIPWVFKFAATFGGEINPPRRKAQCVLFEAGVLRPLADYARRKMEKVVTKDGKPALEWSAKSTAALDQLIRLEAQGIYGGDDQRLDPNALFDYVLLKPEDFKYYRQTDAQNFNSILNWTYRSGGGQPWPPAVLAATAKPSVAAVDKGVADFIEYWKQGGGIEAGEILAAIDVLKKALGRFSDAEKDLLNVNRLYAGKPDQPDTLKLLTTVDGDWRKNYGAVLVEGKSIDGAIIAAKLGIKGLVDAYDATSSERVKRAEKPHNMLVADAKPKKPPAEGAKEGDKAAGAHLQNVVKLVQESFVALQEQAKTNKDRAELVPLDKDYLAVVPIKDSDLQQRLKKDSLRLFELRMTMYGTADQELIKKDAVPGLAGLAPAFKAVLDDSKKDTQTIDNLAAIAPDGFRCPEAAGVSKFVTNQLAKRQRTFAMLSGVLATAPKSGAEVEAKVAEVVKEKNLPAIPRPVIPGTNFKKDQTFEPKFHPKAAMDTFSGWGTIRQYVKPSDEAAKATAKADVVSLDDLAKDYDARQGAYDAYLVKYLGYWTKDVLADLVYNAPNWKSFQADLIGMQTRTVTTDLEGLGKSILSALADVDKVITAGEQRNDYDTKVKKLTAALAKFGTASYMGSWDVWLRRWKDLGSEVEGARRTILGKTPAQFIDDYIPFTPEADTDISENYWKQLAGTGLSLLAKEVNDTVQTSYEGLKAFGRFPLALPKANEKELTGEEVAAARAALDKVMGAAQDYDAKTIGGGATTDNKFPVVDEQFSRLRGLGLGEAKQAWCKKMGEVLRALPPAKEKFTCTVNILADKDQPESAESVLSTWLVLQIDQGGAKAGAQNTTQGESKTVCKLDYPGGDVVFKFYETPASFAAGQIASQVTVPGTWAAIRLLHTLKSERNAQEGTKWKANVVVQDKAGKNRTLRLELVFAKPFPRIDQWP